jgi:hypothetical protein
MEVTGTLRRTTVIQRSDVAGAVSLGKDRRTFEFSLAGLERPMPASVLASIAQVASARLLSAIDKATAQPSPGAAIGMEMVFTPSMVARALIAATALYFAACADVRPFSSDPGFKMGPDDGRAPTLPDATRYFVYEAHRERLWVAEGEPRLDRPSYEVNFDAPSGRSLTPTSSGEAILVFAYEGAAFSEPATFYLKNVRGASSLNVEVKSNDRQVSWYMGRAIPEGRWTRVVLGPAAQSGSADLGSVSEVLIHLKGQATLLLDGFTTGGPPTTGESLSAVRTMLDESRAPDPVSRADAAGALGRSHRWSVTPRLREMLRDDTPFVRFAAGRALAGFHDRSALPVLRQEMESLRTTSRVGLSGVQMLRESEQREVQRLIDGLR